MGAHAIAQEGLTSIRTWLPAFILSRCPFLDLNSSSGSKNLRCTSSSASSITPISTKCCKRAAGLFLKAFLSPSHLPACEQGG